MNDRRKRITLWYYSMIKYDGHNLKPVNQTYNGYVVD